MNVPFQRGMTFGFYSRRGVYTSAWAKEQIRKMKALNIEYVALIATVFHETDYSPREFLDITESPGELELIRMIDFIHAEGQKVMLRENFPEGLQKATHGLPAPVPRFL